MQAIVERSVRVIAVSIVVLLLGTRGLAHHSQSQFDPEATITIEGVLTRASWSNPHTLFFIEAKRAGSTEAVKQWSVEGPSIRQIDSKGWGRTVSKAGDKLTFVGRPRRDGKPELLLLAVTLPDGKTIDFKPE